MTSATVEPVVIRALSPIESWHVVRSATMWSSLRLRGKLDYRALHDAFRALLDAYPVLGCRIRLDDAGFLLVSARDAQPVLSIREEALPDVPASWSLAEGDNVVAVDVVSDGDEHWVSFGLQHAIADGRLSGHYQYWLWTAYSQITSTGIVPVSTPAPITRAPEELLRERGVVQLDHSGVERIQGVVWGGKALCSTGRYPADNQRGIRLDQQTSAALRGAAKTRGVSMNGAVCGAIVKAERALVDAPAGDPVALGLKCVVDIRSRIDPPIAIAEASNCFGMAYSRLAVDAASDPLEIGHRIVSDLKADVASGLIQQQIYHSIPDHRKARPVLFVTNIGEFKQFPMPDGLVIEGVHGCQEIDVTPRRQLPPALAEQIGQLGWASGYQVSSYDGELNIRAQYPTGSFTAEQIDWLAAEIDASLRAVANGECNTRSAKWV